VERHHKFANVITTTVMRMILSQLPAKASRLDVPIGVKNGFQPASSGLSPSTPGADIQRCCGSPKKEAASVGTLHGLIRKMKIRSLHITAHAPLEIAKAS
jgi:hypothetical protein